MTRRSRRAASVFGILATLAALAANVVAGERRSVFDDAVAAWHFLDLDDAAGANSRLSVRGNVELGVALAGVEREASLGRGGDGLVARFGGGYLSAGQGAGGELNLAGPAMTMAVRLRDPSGAWDCPLVAKHGGHDKLIYNLFSTDLGSGVVLGFEMGTTGNNTILRVTVPIDEIGPRDWHDVICRADGAKLEMFVDGRCVDEDFLLGTLRQGNTEPCLVGAESYGGRVKVGFRGMIDHAALWRRALTDAEILALCGGPEAVVSRERTDPGAPHESMQYWRPPNNYFVGDCLPFFHDGIFHFFYLLDKNHHQSKNGLGAHQWAQATSSDLVHWIHQPLAIPITQPWEGSICTGSAFFHDGVYYGFYATRLPDHTQHLSVATSADGIHFRKREPNPFASPPEGYNPLDYRDPTVFRDPGKGLFHMLVTASRAAPEDLDRRGCLAHLVSTDLGTWEVEEPFYVPGLPGAPECPDHFAWNGWYYLVFSNGGLARYRMSRSPLGPWTVAPLDVFGSPLERVAKTAAFTGNRRLSASFLAPAGGGYAGCAVFRELVQHEDGTLGSKFPPEMIPATDEPVDLTWRPSAGATAVDSGRSLALESSDTAAATLTRVLHDARIRMRITPGESTGAFGLRLRTSAAASDGCRLRFDPGDKTVQLGDDNHAVIGGVDGLDAPFNLDVILESDVVDVCIADSRTLIRRWPHSGDGLALFCEAGPVRFDSIEVCPLRAAQESQESWAPKVFGFCMQVSDAKKRSLPEQAQMLILPLDQGDFDNRQLLATLRDAGYRGPIGLMCFGIPGDAREHLQRSMMLWKSWEAEWMSKGSSGE